MWDIIEWIIGLFLIFAIAVTLLTAFKPPCVKPVQVSWYCK